MNRLIGSWKLARLASHAVAGFCILLFVFPRAGTAVRQRHVSAWARGVLDCLQIQLIIKGRPQSAGPLMLVANHTSWLDIAALHAAVFSRFVAKHELRAWPIMGYMAAQAGTLFLERQSRRDALRVVHQTAQSLQDGDVVAIFPEGTTSDGSGLLPFHGNLLQSAISASAPVQPVCIRYLDPRSGNRSMAPNFVGDEHFLTSLWRTLCTCNLVVVLSFAEPQLPAGRTRRVWALDLHASIAQLQQQADAGFWLADSPA